MEKSIQTEIIIHASREKVWEVLTDFSSYALWNPFMVSASGKLAKGQRLKIQLQNGSSTMTFSPAVRSVIPGFSFSWEGRLFFKGLFDGYHFFKIMQNGSNQVKLVQGERFSGIFSRMIFHKIGASTAVNFDRMNRELKKRAEKKEIRATNHIKITGDA